MFSMVGVKRVSSAIQEQVGKSNVGVRDITNGSSQVQNEQLKPEDFSAIQFCKTVKEEPKPTTWTYKNNPWENETVRRDTVKDACAVYGFRPSDAEGSTLKSFAKGNWHDPIAVAEYQRVRKAYHEKNEGAAHNMLQDMQGKGKSREEIARALNQYRNDVRISSYMDGDIVKDENGYQEAIRRAKKNSYENLIKTKTAEQIIKSATKGNAGMDACVGLYDEYFNTY